MILRIVVGISGASGIIYGIRFLHELKMRSIETDVVVTRTAEKLMTHETGLDVKAVDELATHRYDVDDMFAPIASGSCRTEGMAIIPCSMKTLAGVSGGFANNLLLRAAMVTLKENRKLVLVPRETPLSQIDLENMLKLSKVGVTMLPAMPAFYFGPKSIDDLVGYVVGKTLDAFGMQHDLFQRWGEGESK